MGQQKVGKGGIQLTRVEWGGGEEVSLAPSAAPPCPALG